MIVILYLPEGGSEFVHGNQDTSKTSSKTFQAIAWMTDYFETFTDKMPKVDKTAVWNLSAGMAQIDVYMMYEEWCLDTETEKIERSYFYEVWHREFPHVKIPQNSRFKQCDM